MSCCSSLLKLTADDASYGRSNGSCRGSRMPSSDLGADYCADCCTEACSQYIGLTTNRIGGHRGIHNRCRAVDRLIVVRASGVWPCGVCRAVHVERAVDHPRRGAVW